MLQSGEESPTPWPNTIPIADGRARSGTTVARPDPQAAVLNSKLEAEVKLRKKAEARSAELQEKVIQLLLTGDKEEYISGVRKEMKEQADEKEKRREQWKAERRERENAKLARQEAQIEAKKKRALEREKERARFEEFEKVEARRHEEVKNLLLSITKRLDVLEARVASLKEEAPKKPSMEDTSGLAAKLAESHELLTKLVDRMDEVEKQIDKAETPASPTASRETRSTTEPVPIRSPR